VYSDTDACPNDANDDTDGDSIGNNADPDDDSFSDVVELALGTDPLDSGSVPETNSVPAQGPLATGILEGLLMVFGVRGFV